MLARLQYGDGADRGESLTLSFHCCLIRFCIIVSRAVWKGTALTLGAHAARLRARCSRARGLLPRIAELRRLAARYMSLSSTHRLHRHAVTQDVSPRQSVRETRR